MLKRGALALAAVGLIMFAYELFWGLLFPFSPIKLGFERLESERAAVIYPQGENLPADYRALDRLMADAETFHGLNFRKPVAVIICASSAQYRRFSTQRSPLCTMATGTVIYVNPTIRATGRDVEGFLKHELSHAIIYQNTTPWKALKLSSWATEGLAICYGNPHHYYSGPEFARLAEDYFLDIFDGMHRLDEIPADIRYLFLYAEYRSFLEYLIARDGLDKFLEFMLAYKDEPKLEEQLFAEMYGAELRELFGEFRDRVGHP